MESEMFFLQKANSFNQPKSFKKLKMADGTGWSPKTKGEDEAWQGKVEFRKFKILNHSAALVEAKVIVSPLQNLMAKRFPKCDWSNYKN